LICEGCVKVGAILRMTWFPEFDRGEIDRVPDVMFDRPAPPTLLRIRLEGVRRTADELERFDL